MPNINFKLDVTYLQLVSVLNSYFEFSMKALNVQKFDNFTHFKIVFDETKTCFTDFLLFCKGLKFHNYESQFCNDNISTLLEILSCYYQALFDSKYAIADKYFKGDLL